MDLKIGKKRAIVCGSTAGIGEAIAIGLSKEGAEVILVARDEEKLKKTIRKLKTDHGQQHTYIIADFSRPEELNEQIRKGIVGKTVHILINNTGGPAGGKASEALTDDYLKAFQQHLICNQYLVKATLPSMREAGFGRIINIISTSVKQPLSNLGVSNTIRGAVANWAKTLANELGEYNITVNNVLPGATLTGRLESILQNRSLQSGRSLEEEAALMQKAIPANRFAEPDEVADAVLFLASERAAYINGVNLPVDGGRLGCL
ncbi:MAG: 3-oxoacyl-[acyl-carrier protein] reductase [Marivirga sp.]|jgi:3-oxoacyl-[acyl-carrier protein] reductase